MAESAPSQNPYLTNMGLMDLGASNNLLGELPITSLPSNLQSDVSLAGAVSGANQADAGLPAFLQMNSNNPLYNAQGQQLADNYQNEFANLEEMPQFGAAAEQQWLGGNLGTSGSSTFGSGYMSNLAASQEAQSVLEGQQYYTNAVNNQLNERNNYFGNEVLPEEQAMEFNQSADLQALGILNSTALGAAGQYNSNAGTAFNQNNVLAQEQLQAEAASAMNLGNLIGGGAGLLTGGAFALGGGNGGAYLPNVAAAAPAVTAPSPSSFAAPPITSPGYALGPYLQTANF